MNNKLADYSGASLNIDIFRTFLAQWVILGHFGAEFLKYPLVPGRVAVWCFFVLSGYLNMVSFQRRMAINSGWLEASRSYYLSRLWRIYPLLLVSYVVVSLLSGSFFNHDIWTLFPWVYTTTGLNISNGVLWTIIIEIQFYLLTPILYFVVKDMKKWPWFVVLALSMLMVIQIPKLQVAMFQQGHFIDDRSMVGNLGYYFLGMVVAVGTISSRAYLGLLRKWLLCLLAFIFLAFLFRYNLLSTGVQFTSGPYLAILASFLLLTATSPVVGGGGQYSGFWDITLTKFTFCTGSVLCFIVTQNCRAGRGVSFFGGVCHCLQSVCWMSLEIKNTKC